MQLVRESPRGIEALSAAQTLPRSWGATVQYLAGPKSLSIWLVAGVIAGTGACRWDLGLASATLLLPVIGLYYYGYSPQPGADGHPPKRTWTNWTQQRRLDSAQTTAARLQKLNGNWNKDKAASDPMENALDLMQLGRLVRSAVKLVKGIAIQVDDDSFEMAVYSSIPWFKVVERYPLTGDTVSCKRRDLRRGGHTGHVRVTEQGDIALSIAWEDPLGGTGTELFQLVDDDTLHVFSTINVAGQTVAYKNVHRRA